MLTLLPPWGGCRRTGALGIVLAGMLAGFWGTTPVRATDAVEAPKSIRKTCGTCPEGYATTGVTNAPELCKDGEPTLVQCVPLGGAICSQSAVHVRRGTGRSAVRMSRRAADPQTAAWWPSASCSTCNRVCRIQVRAASIARPIAEVRRHRDRGPHRRPPNSDRHRTPSSRRSLQIGSCHV